MWKLKTIEAENLCAFRSLSYMLRQGVTTLIFGDNRDNESQQSNGAGKSALLECIAVGITGSPLRKIRSEEIINDAAEECRIALRFINDSAAEELLVNRRIPRKGASSVSCTLYRGGKQVVTDEAVQPSVDAYNRYILDKLGITRDELLNNFILSKYRYEDFLSSSDKEKKEVINRFSNGYDHHLWTHKPVIIISHCRQRKDKNQTDCQCPEKTGPLFSIHSPKDQEGCNAQTVWNQRCKCCQS